MSNPFTIPTGNSNADIRKWASDNGWTVGAKGRIPTVVLDDFKAVQRVARALRSVH